MALSIAEAFEVKLRVESQLLSLPGVHTVDFGGKLKGGQPTGEYAIIILVEKKRPASELSSEELIPREIEGVKTDVMEAGLPVLHALEGGNRILARINLPGVVSNTPGTLGCFALTTDTTPPKAVLLSNNHVLYQTDSSGKKDDLVIIESCSSCCETVIATTLRTGGALNPLIDAAIAALTPNQQWQARIHGLAVVGTLDLRMPDPGTPDHLDPIIRTAIINGKFMVKKYGAQTDLKKGVIAGLNATTTGGMQQQVRVTPKESEYFSLEGDSGSVIYVDNSQDNNANVVQKIFGTPSVKNPDKAKIVALLWGGQLYPLPGLPNNKASLGSHIEYVVSALKIKIATNSPEVIYQVGGEPIPHPAWARVYSDLSGTERVKEFLSLYSKYEDEIRGLLRTSRRFIVAWHRNHGPKMVRALIAVAEKRASFLPVEFEGKSWTQCVATIADVLLDIGSPALRVDVKHYLPLAVKLGGRAYEEVLGFLVVYDPATVVKKAESLPRP